MSGSNLIDQSGNYGTQGVPDPGNVPGARYGAVSWIDSLGNPWLFGGIGFDSTGAYGYLNDLWNFDGANWIWVGGSNLIDQSGNYGTQGVPAAGNVPGARYGAVSWIDSLGNPWLFGGIGFDSTGAYGYLNDLWKFDGANWIWVSGSNPVNQSGNYGTQGFQPRAMCRVPDIARFRGSIALAIRGCSEGSALIQPALMMLSTISGNSTALTGPG